MRCEDTGIKKKVLLLNDSECGHFNFHPLVPGPYILPSVELSPKMATLIENVSDRMVSK